MEREVVDGHRWTGVQCQVVLEALRGYPSVGLEGRVEHLTC